MLAALDQITTLRPDREPFTVVRHVDGRHLALACATSFNRTAARDSARLSRFSCLGHLVNYAAR